MVVLTAQNPKLELVKYTNGYDADAVMGPIVKAGSAVTWTYVVRNTGNVPMTVTMLTDDKIGSVCGSVGLMQLAAINELPTQLAAGGVLTCTVSGTAMAGQYTNTAMVTGNNVYSPTVVVTDDNPSHYFAVNPSIDLVSLHEWV